VRERKIDEEKREGKSKRGRKAITQKLGEEKGKSSIKGYRSGGKGNDPQQES